MERVEPDGYEMGLTDHRRSPEPKIKHSLAILQDLDRGDRMSSMKASGGMKTVCRFNWSKNRRIRRVEDRLLAREESVLT